MKLCLMNGMVIDVMLKSCIEKMFVVQVSIAFDNSWHNFSYHGKLAQRSIVHHLEGLLRVQSIWQPILQASGVSEEKISLVRSNLITFNALLRKGQPHCVQEKHRTSKMRRGTVFYGHS